MKAKLKENEDLPVSVTFRPNEHAAKIITEWDKTGYERTVLMNTLIARCEREVLLELPKQLQALGVFPRRSFPAPELQSLGTPIHHALAA